VITLDTSAIVALLSPRDPRHADVLRELKQAGPPWIVPVAVLGEVGYFIEQRFGAVVLDRFLADLVAGAFTLDCGEQDLAQVRELALRYADLPLGLVDAAVIACAARREHRVLTLDQRDFGVVARDVPLVILP